MKNISRKIKLLFNLSPWAIPCLIFGLLAYLNLPPRGMVFAGGDLYFWLNPATAADRLVNPWMNSGEGYFNGDYPSAAFFYIISKITEFLGISSVHGLTWFYYTAFLCITYILCLISLKRFDRELSPWLLYTLSLSYALSPFVIRNILLLPNGSSSYYYLYAFFPLLFTLFWRTATGDKVGFSSLLALGWAVFIYSFFSSNIGFLYALCVVFIITYILLLLRILPLPHKPSFSHLLTIFVVVLIPSIWFWLPNISGLLYHLYGLSKTVHETSVSDWVIGFATSFPSAFYAADNVSQYINATTPFALIGSVFFPALFALASQKRVNPESMILFVVLLVLVFVATRGVGVVPWQVVEPLFSSFLFLPVRSPDKFLIFIPFVATIIIVLAMKNSSLFKVRLFTGFILVQVIVTAYPLLSGGVEHKYSMTHPGKSIEDSSYAFFVRIPDDYWHAAAVINRRGCNGKILSLPYNTVYSQSWVHYDKWKFFGSDVTSQLFPCPVINISNSSLGNKYRETFKDDLIYSSEFINHFTNDVRDRSIEYILFHKDMRKSVVLRSMTFINSLEHMGNIRKIGDYDSFNLYKLNEKLFIPRLSARENSSNLSMNGHDPTCKFQPKIRSSKHFLGSTIWIESCRIGMDLKFSDTNHMFFFLLPGETVLESIWNFVVDERIVPRSKVDLGTSHTGGREFGNSWVVDVERVCRENPETCQKTNEHYTTKLQLVFLPAILIIICLVVSSLFMLWLTIKALRVRSVSGGRVAPTSLKAGKND